MRPVIDRLLWEQRVRLPLLVALAVAWGFTLVAVFAFSDDQTRTAGIAGNAAAAFRILGLDPLAAWVSLGANHPILIVACLLEAVAVGVRAIAGELEAGTLDLTLARPIERTRYLLAHVAVIVPASALIAVGYAVGALLGDRVYDPPGAPLVPSRLLLTAVELWLLVIAIGMLALLLSAFSSERGRALSWTLGAVITMYAANFLLPLWGPSEPFARLSLFRWFTPGPTIQAGTFAWDDAAALVAFSLVAGAGAVERFRRRDLV
jgi:ABC-2 type transport system permease protein